MPTNLIKSFSSLLLSLCLLTAFNTASAETGLFWKAESKLSKDIYLFGTIHTDDNRVTNFAPSVTQAIKASDAFMMETLSPNNPGVFMMAEGDLRSMLTEPELDQVYALAEFHVMHRDAALHMKPWLLAVVFDSPRPLTPFAQDNLLMTQAEDVGKQIIGIEDTQEHFGIMDSFSLDEQLVMLRAVLKRSAAEKEQGFASLVQAYLAGDSEAIAALDDKITGNMLPKALWDKMRTKLVDDRNVIMAQRIMEEAKQQKVFVAVGASHLAGQGGLLVCLRAAGYQLSPLK